MSTLRIQFVLFNNDHRRFTAVAATAAHSARAAIASGVITSASMAVGDCSPVPVFDEAALAALEAATRPLACEYQFFNANLGSGGGSNALWENRTEGDRPEFLLVLNPDTMASPSLIREMVRFVASDDAIGVADARQIPMEHPKAYDSVSMDVSWASGACMLLSAAAFDAVGGFAAELFPLYCDDVDLSWRLRLSGYRCVHVPSAVVHHDKRPSATSGRPEASELEHYWAAFGALLMATRWDRPDVVEDVLRALEQSADPVHERAMTDFRSLRREGRLPEPIPGAERVAEFVEGNYAEHRF